MTGPGGVRSGILDLPHGEAPASVGPGGRAPGTRRYGVEREGRAGGAASRGAGDDRGVRPVVRLSAKALRRYDELGLLRPALVDPVNGYRYYDPAQVEGPARGVAAQNRHAAEPDRPGRGARRGAAAVESQGLLGARGGRDGGPARSGDVPRRPSVSGGRDDVADAGQSREQRKFGECGERGGAGDPVCRAHRYRRWCVRRTRTRRSRAPGCWRSPTVSGGRGRGECRGDRGTQALHVGPGRCAVRRGSAERPGGRGGFGCAGGADAVAPCEAPDGSGTTLTAMLWTGSRLGLVRIGTRGPICCAAGSCSGSRTITAWSSR